MVSNIPSGLRCSHTSAPVSWNKMVIQLWVWRELLGQPVGLEKPQHIISVEIGAEQPVGREGERKDMSFSPLPSRELGVRTPT